MLFYESHGCEWAVLSQVCAREQHEAGRLGKVLNDSDVESQLRELREWVKANSRRIEELEATAFQLLDEDEVLIVAIPRKRERGSVNV